MGRPQLILNAYRHTNALGPNENKWSTLRLGLHNSIVISTGRLPTGKQNADFREIGVALSCDQL